MEGYVLTALGGEMSLHLKPGDILLLTPEIIGSAVSAVSAQHAKATAAREKYVVQGSQRCAFNEGIFMSVGAKLFATLHVCKQCDAAANEGEWEIFSS
jgi:hypothetical protein